jgi:hypothetical protein
MKRTVILSRVRTLIQMLARRCHILMGCRAQPRLLLGLAKSTYVVPYVIVAFRRRNAILVDGPLARGLCTNGTLNAVTRMRLPRIRLGVSVGKFPQPEATTAFSRGGYYHDIAVSHVQTYSSCNQTGTRMSLGWHHTIPNSPHATGTLASLHAGCATSPCDNGYHEGL